MAVMIGVDPHKASHTAAAIGPAGWAPRYKARSHRDRQAVREPAHRASRTLRQTAALSGSIRRLGARSRGPPMSPSVMWSGEPPVQFCTRHGSMRPSN